MLQYLLNATIIWLLSLLCYDLLLKKETFHSYNRIYLLATFLMGILIPLWQWQDDSFIHRTRIEDSVEQVINTKQQIVTASAESSLMGWEQWLIVLYLVGAVIALSILMIEVVKLYRLQSNGNKYKQEQWTIIETGKDHAPFSLFNTLFVSSPKLYSDEEWSMILSHEQRHTTLLHFADLLLLQLAKIVFWFHPLVYVYNTRLLLVHEYQADNASAKEPAVYGRFLVEQAVLQAAPSITHSFNRSPVKNRILMLTRKSSTTAKIKMFAAIPLALVCIVCFSKSVFSQKFERNGKYVTYKGNKFELSESKTDTMILTDPVNGKETTTFIKKEPTPVKVNGKLIPGKTDQPPYYTGSEPSLREYLLANMKTELGKLDDGMYTLNIDNILVDARGKIIYFDYKEIRRSKVAGQDDYTPKPTATKVTTLSGPAITVNMNGQTSLLSKNTDPDAYAAISKSNQDDIFSKVCDLMQRANAFNPATLNGKKVVAHYYTPRFWNHFKVKDHKLYDVTSDGNFKEL